MTWKVPGQNYVRCYDYTYDGMNRLVEGAYSHLRVFTPFPGIISSTGEEILSMGGSSSLSIIPVIDAPGDLVGPISINAADQYTERISYDKNSNITSIERYGMNNQRQYGLIDSLVITRNGNQLKSIEDYAEKHLTYTGASDFYDGYSYNTEYYYNANGALESDINRDIDLIQYDDLGNTRCIYYFGQNQIEYIYAADGTKLRTIHRPSSSSALTDSIDYIGNLILKNSQPSMYLFDGGYATFNTSGAVNGWHYYIQDYMGNNRMVVNKNGTVEQVTHYYPYGGVIGDISTNESVQKYKFEGKELDRTFGLDNYDIHARQYFAMAPMWDKPDSLAEKFYSISPYAFCGGDPVNLGDYNGKDMCVLIAPSGANEMGHMAILIQGADQKWYLYSKNGTNSFFGLSGPNSADKGDDIGSGTIDDSGEEKGWENPQEFLNSDVNKKDGQYYYTQGYLIESEKDSDTAARNAACEELKKGYSVIGSNCANTVQQALEAAGKSSGHFKLGTDNGIQQLLIPKGRYKMIVRDNKGLFVFPLKQ